MTLERLPPDNFGVRVMCRDDRTRLLWLANEIGEECLRSSVRSYRQRFAGSMPYVSKILRWHNLDLIVDEGVPVHGPQIGRPYR